MGKIAFGNQMRCGWLISTTTTTTTTTTTRGAKFKNGGLESALLCSLFKKILCID